MTEITDQVPQYHVSFTHAERDIIAVALTALHEKFAALDESIGVEVGPREAHRSYTNEQVYDLFCAVEDKLYPEDEDDPSS